jgi:hypothetical protein
MSQRNRDEHTELDEAAKLGVNLAKDTSIAILSTSALLLTVLFVFISRTLPQPIALLIMIVGGLLQIAIWFAAVTLFRLVRYPRMTTLTYASFFVQFTAFGLAVLLLTWSLILSMPL